MIFQRDFPFKCNSLVTACIYQFLQKTLSLITQLNFQIGSNFQ